MRKTYEFRLKPTRAQERRLIATLNACRVVYNWGIEDRKNLWGYCHVSTSFYDQSDYLKHLKDANPFLKEVHAHPLQDALRRVERAFDGFFRRTKNGKEPGHPRFKGRSWYDSFTFKERQFLGILSRSAESAGGACRAVEAQGTSQECSECGVIVHKSLSERLHRCWKCGLVLDRDVNAARLILKRGLGRPIGEGSGRQLVPMIREAAPL